MYGTKKTLIPNLSMKLPCNNVGRNIKKKMTSFIALPTKKIIDNCDFFFAFKQINMKNISEKK